MTVEGETELNASMPPSSVSPVILKSGGWHSRTRFFWPAAIGLTVLVQVATLSLSPLIWQDEVQNNDLGRATLWERGSSWGINWLPENRPEYWFAYLGVASQELIYRWTGPTNRGVRLWTLAGAIFAAIILRSLLAVRGLNLIHASLVSAIFLWDPLFVQTYRGGRVDSWCIGLVLLSCLFLQKVGDTTHRKQCAYAAASGVSIAVAGFVWPSALLLVPFVLYCAVSRPAAMQQSLPLLAVPLYFLAAAVATALLLVLPIWPVLTQSIHDFSRNIGMDVTTNTATSLRERLYDAAVVAMRSPVLACIAVLGAMVRSNRGLALAAAVSLLLVFRGIVYANRIVYLLPFAALMLVPLLSPAGSVSSASSSQRLGRIMLAAALIWAAGLTLVTRPLLAWSQREARNPDNLRKVAANTLGRGAHAVYVPIELYYAGRELGWRMYREAGAGDVQQRVHIWQQVDYVFLNGNDTDVAAKEHLLSLGFDAGTEVLAGRDGITYRVGPFRSGDGDYGPLVLFSRTAAKKAGQDLGRAHSARMVESR